MSTIRHTLHHVSNGAGWQLGLHQTWDESLETHKKPVLIVPGYGMNSFIFSYHPTGPSFERFLVERGFEVWRVDLRAQGDAVATTGNDQFTMQDLAVTDLGAAVAAVRGFTHTKHERVDVIGASLGGTLIFAHMALVPEHSLGTIVSMGTPLRWVRIHPLARAAMASPWLIGKVRFRGTRKLAELALPQLVRFVPWVLSIYMNPDITDTSAAKQLVRTIENPNRYINRQIAKWVRARDLVLSGVNIGQAIAKVDAPYMCVIANKDGIVPRETALFPYTQVRSRHRKLLEVGTQDLRLAHADLFISDVAHRHVFHPIAEWLDSHQGSTIQPRD